jgi:hypothetical protein
VEHSGEGIAQQTVIDKMPYAELQQHHPYKQPHEKTGEIAVGVA